jgi:transposase-like protein
MGKHKEGYVTKGGMVEVDELYSGGNPKNMHAAKRYGREPKAIIFGIKERGGYTLTKHVPNNRKETLQPEIERHVKPESPISSDGHKSYIGLSEKGYIHDTVDHSEGQYVKGRFHTNSIEGVWAVQERAYYGTYHNFSKKYRYLYLNEFDFRLNIGNRQTPMMDAIDKLISACWLKDIRFAYGSIILHYKNAA